MPVIVHIDMNCFFASCEIRKDPSLKGKKVIIGGMNSRSIVSACSYEARSDGVHSAMPIYQARELCKDGIFLPVDYEYYEKVHEEIFGYLKSIYKIVDVASIDEAYIDMSDVNLGKDPYQYFVNLQKYIYENMHIPCSIGVSFCPFLAKMGSDYKKPLGITIIKKKDVPSLIYPLPIGDAYGCGKQTSAKLIEIGIKTIEDFVKSDDYRVREILGSFYERLKAECMGEVAEHVTIHNEPIKSIGNSHTLDRNTDDYEVIKENIKFLCDKVSFRLKAEKMLGYTITLTLKDANFVSKNKSKQIIEPTDDNDKIAIECLKLYEKFQTKVIRLVGVSVSTLIFKEQYTKQLSLFSKENEENNDVRILISKFNKMAGKDILMRASDKK